MGSRGAHISRLARRGGRRFLAVVTLAATCLAGGPGRGEPADLDVGLWVYDTHAWPPESWAARLSGLPLSARRLYLSVEAGPVLLVDDPALGEHLGSLLEVAVRRHGLAVEAMILQDPSWGGNPDGALARTDRLLAFHRARRARGHAGFAGLHLDIEPHTEEPWACATAGERRAIVRSLQALFGRIGRAARAADPALRLTAALPWWLGPLSGEVPEGAPVHWLAELDEVVLMAYGDPGGPVVGGSPGAVLSRVDDARLWRALPPGRGLRVGLATYEHRGAADLAATAHGLAKALRGRPGFRGVALFAHGQPFDVPLVSSLRGRVVDRAGRPVPGARVGSGGRQAVTSRCGEFVLRDLGAGAVELVVETGTRAPVRLIAPGLTPGREVYLPAVILE
jgi:hypothetical protein